MQCFQAMNLVLHSQRGANDEPVLHKLEACLAASHSKAGAASGSMDIDLESDSRVAICNIPPLFHWFASYYLCLECVSGVFN